MNARSTSNPRSPRRRCGRRLAFAAVLSLAGAVHAAEAPAAAEGVAMPLPAYLDLVEKARAASRVAPPSVGTATIAAQSVAVRVDEDGARLESRFEVDVRARGGVPIALPVGGRIEEVSLEPRTGAALYQNAGRELTLVTSAPGRFRVVATSRAVDPAGGAEVFAIPTRAGAAEISEVRLDLPASVAWELLGAVVLEERVDGARRVVRLAVGGGPGTLSVRRAGGTATVVPTSVVARSVAITHVDLRSDEVVRLDTLQVEVLRGSLSTIEARLPAGAVVERAWMDDGGEVDVAAGRAVGRRKQKLTGGGYLKLLMRTPGAPAAALALPAIEPSIPVRARYLVVSSSVAATLAPRPAAAWSTVDLTDPPDSLAAELSERPPVAGWRLETPDAEGALEIALLPSVDLAPRPIHARRTSTFVNADGSVLTEDRFEVGGEAGALALRLPPGVRFESATVAGDVVRPIERDGRQVLPLRYDPEARRLVVVTLTDAPLVVGKRPVRRRFEVPEVEGVVVEHTWRLHLPPGVAGRLIAGDLRSVTSLPSAAMAESLALSSAGFLDADSFEEIVVVEKPKRALETGSRVTTPQLEKIPTARDPWSTLQAAPGVATDRLNVGGNESGQQSNFAGAGTAVQGRPDLAPIPGGTAILFSGALPAERIGVEIEVKAKRGR